MADFLLVGAGLALFGLMFGYAALCRHL